MVIFRRFFSVGWLYFEINQSLVDEITCTIYSFIHASTQYHILNKNSFQQCLFSTEVHNPLHAHLLALSHVQKSDKMYISYYMHWVAIHWGNMHIDTLTGYLMNLPVHNVPFALTSALNVSRNEGKSGCSKIQWNSSWGPSRNQAEVIFTEMWSLVRCSFVRKFEVEGFRKFCLWSGFSPHI